MRRELEGVKKERIHIVTTGNLPAGRAPMPPERMPRGGHFSGDLLFLLLPAGHVGEFYLPSVSLLSFSHLSQKAAITLKSMHATSYRPHE